MDDLKIGAISGLIVGIVAGMIATIYQVINNNFTLK